MSSNKNQTADGRNKVAIKKPNPVLFFLCCILVIPFLKIKCKASCDRSGLKDMKGSALILCPHISNIDFILVAMTLFPRRPTFVVSEHFMARPLIRWFLRKMHVISKKMFCPDIKTIMNIFRARDSGNIVVLFPEGRLACVGHSLQVTDGTAELVKKMGVSVYTVTGSGAYKTLPKWGKAGIRSGKISITTAKLFDASEIKELSALEISRKIDEAMLHDEDKLFTDVSYKCKSPASGLDGVLYKCPSCGEEFRMRSDPRRISCEVCGFSSELTERYELKGEYFSSINDWYFWQQEQIDLDVPLRSETILAAADDKGNMDRGAGRGVIYMDKDTIRFSGECFGKPLEFTESTSDIKAFPVSVGDHFDLYHKKRMYNFILQPEPKQAVKWMQYLDKVTEEAAEAQEKAEAAEIRRKTEAAEN